MSYLLRLHFNIYAIITRSLLWGILAVTDDIWPHCWRSCCRCLDLVEMLGTDAKTSGSSVYMGDILFPAASAFTEECVTSLDRIQDQV